ncbi:uncharacterized protein LOC120514099 [Passer montanus]|uniref:uncharacterized protein LOC120514099 n=1 Tax=Passer montanus TaxID=9160 RepID=UPI001960CBCD|nr:uncharacterized protein LOC120514099 [Passer montanus]
MSVKCQQYLAPWIAFVKDGAVDSSPGIKLPVSFRRNTLMQSWCCQVPAVMGSDSCLQCRGAVSSTQQSLAFAFSHSSTPPSLRPLATPKCSIPHLNKVNKSSHTAKHMVEMRVWRGTNKCPKHLVRAIAPGDALALSVHPWLSTSCSIQTDCDTPGKPESPAAAAWSGAERTGTWCVLSSELRDWQPGPCGGMVAVVCVNFEPVQEKAHHFLHALPGLSWRHRGCCGSTAPEDVHKILPLLCSQCSWWLPAAG